MFVGMSRFFIFTFIVTFLGLNVEGRSGKSSILFHLDFGNRNVHLKPKEICPNQK
jgi:hypothetical protein